MKSEISFLFYIIGMSVLTLAVIMFFMWMIGQVGLGVIR